MLPAGMDGKYNNGVYGNDNSLHEWQKHAAQTISRSMERPGEQHTAPKTRPPQSTIRAVTPDSGPEEENIGSTAASLGSSNISSSRISPRSTAGGGKARTRRPGTVFEASHATSDSSMAQSLTTTPPQNGGPGSSSQSGTRPRTRTLEEPRRRNQPSASATKSRHRIGSTHSTGSAVLLDETRPSPGSTPKSDAIPPEMPQAPLQKSGSIKERSRSARRLVKKRSQSSPRPSSPVTSPNVDSLPVPVETSDANKILKLMKSLSGRMKGMVEYQSARPGPWSYGLCRINDLKGALVIEDGDGGPFYQVLLGDLRGCRVRPTISTEKQDKCLEVSTISGLRLLLLPLVSTEFDHWLAALLCWQQSGHGTSHINLSTPDATDGRKELSSRISSHSSTSNANIIKVGKLLLWDKGTLLSPTSILRRLANKDARSARRSWRRVSCILQENGEFKLLTENDVTLLSVIQLSQLSRCAIQQLDRSVLNEGYCIAIFPQYASTSTSISIIRPVCIALESRVLFEVWFVLLRALAIPELYGLPYLSAKHEGLHTAQKTKTEEGASDLFRIEKSLSIRIIEAKVRRLPYKADPTGFSKPSAKQDADPIVGDYFAEVILDGEIRSKTMTKLETKNPFWREDCEFCDLPAALPPISIVLKRLSAPSEAPLTMRSSTSIHSSDQVVETLCGSVDLQLDNIEKNKETESWWPVLDSNQDTIGEIFLKIRHDETFVLMAKDYQPISELLHRFGSGLTLQIAQAIPSKLRILSETLMNIFQVSGKSASWLMTLVEDEIDGVGKETQVRRFRYNRRVGSNDSFDSGSEREHNVRDMGKSLTGEANLLFRGNSLLTQALDFHMRRVGKEYLEEVLFDKIAEINTVNPDCEVDPSRLSQGDEPNKNWERLTALTTGLWDSIASSAKRCPAEVRQILKFIRAVAEDRYGDYLRTVTYTSVSGFLFLRFFCPAILNPKLFGLLRDHPRPKAQRTLTLIAKSLQVLANLTTFGQKEEWMEPMNRFLSSHRQGVKDFIDEVCSISAERSTIAVPASYSTPITIMGRLPPTSREGFPSLPYLIDPARNFAILIKLWLDSTHHTIPAHNLDGDLIEFHEKCVAIQQRTNDAIRNAEEAQHLGGGPHLQWDDVAASLSRTSLQPLHLPNPNAIAASNTDLDHSPTTHSRFPPFAPINSSNDGHNSNPASQIYTASAMAPGSSGSATSNKEREGRDRQKFWEQTFGKDSKFSQKPYEPDLTDTSKASPPTRGMSGGGVGNPKGGMNFFTGLRKKGVERETDRDKDAEREKNRGKDVEREKNREKEKGGRGKTRRIERDGHAHVHGPTKSDGEGEFRPGTS